MTTQVKIENVGYETGIVHVEQDGAVLHSLAAGESVTINATAEALKITEATAVPETSSEDPALAVFEEPATTEPVTEVAAEEEAA